MSLVGVDLGSACLEFAVFDGADLQDADFDYSDLSGATFKDARLDRAHFIEASVSGARFERAQLHQVVLSAVDGSYADFTGANLRGAVLYHADMTEAGFTAADLTGADLSNTNFTRAKLDQAVFGAATMADTVLAAVDLSDTKGLDAVQHFGPSTIGVDTLYLSRSLPESFLRGAGIPEKLIRELYSTVSAQERDNFYSCFISHSSADATFVEQLRARLNAKHLRVWSAPVDMRAGRNLHDQICAAIRGHDKLLIVLSEASLRSDWVATELREAFSIQKQIGTQKLFPIRLIDIGALKHWQCFDVDTGNDLAAKLREYYIPDFSDWKDASKFETEFQRLVEALKLP